MSKEAVQLAIAARFIAGDSLVELLSDFDQNEVDDAMREQAEDFLRQIAKLRDLLEWALDAGDFSAVHSDEGPACAACAKEDEALDLLDQTMAATHFKTEGR